MNNKNQNTDEILSAIRDMMNEEETKNEQPLPKDVLELTESVEEQEDPVNRNNVLELTNLVSDNDTNAHLESVAASDVHSETEEDELRKLVRESINEHASEKIDLIIKQEMKKIIEEKISKAKVVIDSKNKS